MCVLSFYLAVCSALLHVTSLLQSSTQAHSNRTDDDDNDDDDYYYIQLMIIKLLDKS